MVDMAPIISCVNPKVTQEMNDQLLSPFSKEEIKKVLMDMHPTKAPGSDGLPAMFSQKFWDVLGDDILKAALIMLNEGGEISAWNKTLITLIPKVKSIRINAM